MDSLGEPALLRQGRKPQAGGKSSGGNLNQGCKMFWEEKSEISEEILEQFEDMCYTLTCNECGKQVLPNVLHRDFDRTTTVGDMREMIVKHNLTHVEVWACEEDDIFGVDHSKCNHSMKNLTHA